MTRTRIIVLGAAAGGGFPQWNCNCRICALYWQGDARVGARTQSSIAVSGNERDWVLFNCSPDVRSQIINTPALRPQAGARHSPICCTVLTNGDIDHVAGLLSMRESQPFSIFATASILDAIAANPMFAAVNEALVPRRRLSLGDAVALPGGLEMELFAVPGKVPLYLEDEHVEIGAETETTIGVKVSANDKSFFYIPGCAAMPETLAKRIGGAELVLFDGTLWRDDEMIAEGVGQKTGQRMGHMSMSGPDGSMAAFAPLCVKRKVYIHINNTNPVLIEGSAECSAAEQAGWEIASDGMEIVL